jgi:tetratricopeptide (TPR) repeat protein
MQNRRTCALVSLWVALATGPVYADGPGAYRPPARSSAAPALSAASAIDAYNSGYAAVQRADHAQALAEAASDPAEKRKSERVARDAYKESQRYFEAAVHADASMHEAYTYLGYANRKLGRHSQALAAYEQALRINPDYPHAIEYQGQALLGLNRFEEARFNYLRLYALNKAQAGKLLRAMQSWVVSHDGETDVSAFADWVAQRTELTRADPVTESGW